MHVSENISHFDITPKETSRALMEIAMLLINKPTCVQVNFEMGDWQYSKDGREYW